MKKYGKGKVIPEKDDDKKVAKKNFTKKDREELVEESTEDSAPTKTK
jgi:hypothetical protein